MKRTHRREFVMNDEEAADLRNKARSACMPESQLIRRLIKGYHPPLAPDETFHSDMTKLLDSCEALTEAAEKLNKQQGRGDVVNEACELREMRRIFLRKYLTGERKRL